MKSPLTTCGIIYFTGTNNSEIISQKVEKKLTIDHSISSIRMKLTKKTEQRIINSINQFDQLIFITPVYAMALPQLFRKFLSKLPKSKNQSVMIIICKGEFHASKEEGHSGIAPLQAEKILKKKQYNVIISEDIGTPHNVTIVFNPVTKKEFSNIFEEADEKLEILIQSFMKSEIQIIYRSLWLKIFSILFYWGFQLGRRMIGMSFVASNKCNSCQICEQQCPNHTIKNSADCPIWRMNCQGCLRCYNICPHRAIQLSIIRLIVLGLPYAFIYPFSFIPISWEQIPHVFSDIPNYGIVIIKFLIYVINIFFWKIIYYHILNLMQNFSVFRNIFAFSFTIRIPRYLAT